MTSNYFSSISIFGYYILRVSTVQCVLNCFQKKDDNCVSCSRNSLKLRKVYFPSTPNVQIEFVCFCLLCSFRALPPNTWVSLLVQQVQSHLELGHCIEDQLQRKIRIHQSNDGLRGQYLYFRYIEYRRVKTNFNLILKHFIHEIICANIEWHLDSIK